MSGPSGIISGPDGALWFTETVGNKIGKIVLAAAGAPTASFTANPTSGTAPLAVTFTDTSTGSPTAWSWSFGDGTKSTSQNPKHTYTKAGVYKVTLTASNSAGSSSTSQTITVTVSATEVPGAPTIVSVTPGNEQVTVNFKPPSSNGGSRITKYTVSSNLGNTATGAGSPITVKKLINGTDYTFTVTATNINGPGPPSSPPFPATPATKPGAPTGVEATAGNGEATITFTVPSSDGGSAITGYTAIPSPKAGVDKDAGTTSTTHTVTGLKNGTRYSFTVEATNAVGSTTSKPSNSVTPATVPGEPTDVKATAGKTKGTVTVSFKPPASNGGSSIIHYTVESPQDGSVNVTGKSSPITVTGLTSGTDCTFTVFATNSEGNGQPSGASNSVAAP
ncbi:MAG: fibronectin type III domain-containing protein [Syntrophobacteraceae bacterium]